MPKFYAIPIILTILLGFLTALGLKVGSRLVRRRRIAQARIATALPDALLQDFQGVLLRVQAAVEQVSPELPARKVMDEALDSADGVLSRAREEIERIRISRSGTIHIPKSGRRSGNKDY